MTEQEMMWDVARRFVAIHEREQQLLDAGFLTEEHGMHFHARTERRSDAKVDVSWRRTGVTPTYGVRNKTCNSRYITRVVFAPLADWDFLVEELCVGADSMLRFDFLDGRWRPNAHLPQFWRVAHRTASVEIQGGMCRNAREPRLFVKGDGCDAIYPWEDDDLRIDQLVNGRFSRPEPSKMPKVRQLDRALITAEGRVAYLAAARAWSEGYLADCAAWAGGVERLPESIPYHDDAYWYGDLRIPAELFDFECLMQRLVGKLNALLAHLPPDNKYVASAAR